MSKLAIVLPVYKSEYLRETLDALALQTSQNFTVYIGDDNSPANIRDIVECYKDKLDIRYTKFDKNLGGTNLVKHWNRCLDLIVDEEWVWLFSDDDKMDSQCVAKFYNEINGGANYDVYHFNIDVIDEDSKLLKHTPEYPDTIDVNNFFSLLYMGRIEARMPEFVFRRTIIQQKGGFVDYDLAWRSDNATVIKMAEDKGIKTVSGAKVMWRQSSFNISGNTNLDILVRKDNSTIRFFNWVDDLFANKGLKYEIDVLRLIRAYSYCIKQTKGRHSFSYYWSISQKYNYLDNIFKRLVFVLWCYKNK